jgi:hypothetical protein
MGSSIYFIEVTNLNCEQMFCSVSCTSAIISAGDQYDFTASPSLALAFLWETWNDMRRGMVESSSGDSMSCDLWCPFGLEEARNRANNAYIAQFMPNDYFETMFLEFAPLVIATVEINDRRRCGRKLRMYEPFPECTYVITPTDSRFLEHMAIGMRWGTASYEMEIY